VVEYCLGTLQTHLQNKCVITKYDYCGWYGCRVATIPLYDRTRVLFIIIYRTLHPPTAPLSRVVCFVRIYACGHNGGGSCICSGHSLAECNFTKQYITTFTSYLAHPPSRLVCQYNMTTRFPFYFFSL